MGVMSSYNRLGLMETAASYPLLTEVLRGEWGFKGAVLSDMTHHGNNGFDHKCYENINYRALAGCNMQLDNSSYKNDIAAKWDNNANDGKGCPVYTSADGSKTESYSWWYAVRTLAHEVLWEYSRSGGMDKNLAQAVEGIVIDGNKASDQTLNLELGKSVSLEITGEGDYEDAEFTLNSANVLPAGLSYDAESHTISGAPTKVGSSDIHVLATYNNGSKDVTVGKIVHINVFDPAADDESAVQPIDNKNKGGLDTGAIVGISAGSVAVVAAIAAVVIILLKKKKVA